MGYTFKLFHASFRVVAYTGEDGKDGIYPSARLRAMYVITEYPLVIDIWRSAEMIGFVR